jgi:hypothetical protein
LPHRIPTALILLRESSSPLVVELTPISIPLLLLESIRLLVRILPLLTAMILKIPHGKPTRRCPRGEVESWLVLRTPTITASI